MASAAASKLVRSEVEGLVRTACAPKVFGQTLFGAFGAVTDGFLPSRLVALKLTYLYAVCAVCISVSLHVLKVSAGEHEEALQVLGEARL